jgi:hypothetical protein
MHLLVVFDTLQLHLPHDYSCFVVGDGYCHEQKTIGKTKKHYDASHEIGNKWPFTQHAYFNIW